MEEKPRGNRWFRPLYIGWAVFVLFCLCWGFAKYGHVPAALLPAGWAWHKNSYPDCGVEEMERMVAEGTAYFESHREELEQQAAAGEDPFFWATASGRTFGSLEYYGGSLPDWDERGYPMHYPLDAHWALCFFEDYS